MAHLRGLAFNKLESDSLSLFVAVCAAGAVASQMCSDHREYASKPHDEQTNRRTNVFEYVPVAEDSYQVIISTIGETYFSARVVTLGVGSF
jgi:hypothetical protein